MIECKFNSEGLIPVIAQDYKTGEVLMLAYMDKDALAKTIECKKMCYYSRSRKKFWVKGETSGNVQLVKELFVDCDKDTIVAKVEQVGGAACHEGYRTCFYRKISNDGNSLTAIGERVFDPKDVYGDK
ncbi:MAG: phosphoribosyl-AMP cyclohydrolase [Candidatus Omnitrophica bacterium]|nr:phosphoribosyl-AMP cyclohydrolase [Candidatus Omnitrophota bacterium]